MATKRLIIGLTGLLGLIAADCATPTKITERSDASIAAGQERPLTGYLEHRGNLYRLDDLLDARQRAASRDPFVRQFDPSTNLADWAGM